MGELTNTQLAVYSLVKEFVQRQSLVYDALKDIRPDFVGVTDEERRRPSKDYIRATQKGNWGKNKEWTYYIHGGGCALTHAITGEPIEWDAPDLHRFDPYWFVNWVKWRVRQNAAAEIVGAISSRIEDQDEEFRKFIFDILGQLSRLGLLRYHPERTNMYELV